VKIKLQKEPMIYEIPGCDSFIIKREDVTNRKAWFKLTRHNYPHLSEKDFNDYDIYTKYYLVTMGLLDYSMVMIFGEEGGGKSLVMSWFIYQIGLLFGKKSILDVTPPFPELYNEYYDFSDSDYANKIQKQLNILVKIEKEATIQGKKLSKEAYKSVVIYNADMGIDEGDRIADKSNRTNVSKFVGRVIRRRRHFHTNIFMIFVDPNDADKRMVADRITHTVKCCKNSLKPGWCSYQIECVKGASKGISKSLELKPADWQHIWRSHGAVSISHDQYINLGGKQRNTDDEEY
jgi:hypothetical protein